MKKPKKQKPVFLEDLMKTIIDMSKEMLVDTGDISPVAIIQTGTRNMMVDTPFNSKEEIPEVYNTIIEGAKKCNATAILFSNTAKIKLYENKETCDYAVDNWDTEAPSTYPENLRNECLIIQCYKFDARNEAFVESLTIIPFKRNKKKIMFGNIIKETDMSKMKNINAVDMRF